MSYVCLKRARHSRGLACKVKRARGTGNFDFDFFKKFQVFALIGPVGKPKIPISTHVESLSHKIWNCSPTFHPLDGTPL
jgi:hypothetical protein